ncbi:MAG: hypothetical protein EZS28_021391, partial [Streblomastix strix]
PDQVTPASDATPLADSGTGVAGTSNEYSRGVHKHQLQVSGVLPSKDTSVGTVGQASSYARSDHQHPIQTVDTILKSDSANGSYGTVDSYARNDHSHPINVQTNASIVPVVNGIGNSGSSAYYSRHDHVHPQQLTYDGNVTATKFIKYGGTVNDILLADASNYDDGLRIARTEESTGGSSIFLGCNRTSIVGSIANQLQIFTPPSSYVNNPLGFEITTASDSGDTTRGLQISADGNTLTFNSNQFVDLTTDQSLSGNDAQNPRGFTIVKIIAPVGSVNYSQDNPILWGTNSLDTDGGFYTNGQLYSGEIMHCNLIRTTKDDENL